VHLYPNQNWGIITLKHSKVRMKFHRVYIELTNICGLACTFCPPKILPAHTMSLSFFEHILIQLKPYTKELAYHIVGDPLVLSNLEAYLTLTCKHGFKVSLTSSGYFLENHDIQTLLHPAIKQVNISLNSFNKNALPLSFEAYMRPILNVCEQKKQMRPEVFINLRLWNLDEKQSEHAFNTMLFAYLEKHFNDSLPIKTPHPKSLRLDEKILLHFDSYFEWPSLTSSHHSHGTCQGLDSHIGILADGTVVPCCLDKDGIVPLGNLHVSSLDEILSSQRVYAIRHGFKEGHCLETLCQKCTYKERFKEKK